MKRHTPLYLLFVLAILSVAHSASAQESQTLTVTPPLFQLSVEPGGVWQSYVKVVNSNPYDLTIFTEVVNFAPQGETGQGRFIPLLQGEDKDATLAEWITIGSGPYVIKREQSYDVPFLVEVPNDAPPGGHFAAILVTTQPSTQDSGSLAVVTSQSVTSLFFVRIEGDVIENADIREFRVLERFAEKPEAEFSLRFENKGNVHLQPRGDIIITNMWGRERGIIPINHKSHYGNVLPQSVRDFRFTWKGEQSITEIGRYKAIATLGYGANETQSVSSISYFWVIPVKATLITIAVIALLISLIVWMIRLYVRRMLVLAGVNVDTIAHENVVTERAQRREVKLTSYRVVAAPLARGTRDLKSRLSGVSEFIDVLRTLSEFIIYYRVFFASVLVLIFAFVGLVFYVSDATKEQRTYEITIHEGDVSETLNSEAVLHNRSSEDSSQGLTTQPFRIEIINGSGEPGLGSTFATMLEDAGYRVDVLDTEKTLLESTTIVSSESLQTERALLQATIENGYAGTFNPKTMNGDEALGTTTIQIHLGADAFVE
jgi:hypothetical protein